MSSIENSLITSGISISCFALYKIIQHYRLKSSCNANNQLVVEVVDVSLPTAVQSPQPSHEIKEEV
jgi:hypothetical protein